MADFFKVIVLSHQKKRPSKIEERFKRKAFKN